jgi:2-phospho-L-lactate guanylyltransferase
MTVAIAVLMKDPADAKTRLSLALGNCGRERLALRMFERTLSFFRHYAPGDFLLVVTPSRGIAKLARAAQASVVWDPGSGGINAAAGSAAVWAVENSASALLVVHADVPVLRKDEFDLLFRSSGNNNVVIAESVDGGTNAIMLSPPNAMDFAFGPASALAHEEEARRRHLRVTRIKARFLSRDIDTPEDLKFCLRLTAFQGVARIATS